MDWTLFGQIAGPIIGLLGIGVMVLLVLLPRREKVKIRINIDYKVDAVTPQIKLYWAGEFQRSGGKDVRYIKRILLRAEDRHTYRKLCKYFVLPENGKIEIDERLKLPGDVIVSSYQGGELPVRPVYQALPKIPRTAEIRDAAQQIASELSQKSHKVRLVWEDGGKTKWKIISPGELGKWVRL